VGEPHLDATDGIESLEERRFQPDVDAGEIVFDLAQFACADSLSKTLAKGRVPRPENRCTVQWAAQDSNL
jgi:hypothetical protein